MAFFTELTTSLKHKWLQYFQVNRFWLARHMEVEYVETPDGGRRPSSYLILGVVSALEPQLAELIVPFIKLNSDVNALIDVLELNFDPELSQGSSFNSTAHLNESMDALVVLVNEDATNEDQDTRLGSEQTIDTTRNRGEKRSDDEEISRLFPDF